MFNFSLKLLTCLLYIIRVVTDNPAHGANASHSAGQQNAPSGNNKWFVDTERKATVRSDFVGTKQKQNIKNKEKFSLSVLSNGVKQLSTQGTFKVFVLYADLITISVASKDSSQSGSVPDKMCFDWHKVEERKLQ